MAAKTLLDHKLDLIQTGQIMAAGLLDLFNTESVVIPRINFMTHNALTYEYTERNGFGGVQYRALNEGYDTPRSVRSPKRETLRIFGGDVVTDPVLVDVNGMAARDDEVAAKTIAAGKFFDREFFHGDPGTNPKAIAGLKWRLNGTDQELVAAANGESIKHKKLIALQDSVPGPNSEKVLFMNRELRQDLSADIGSTAGGLMFQDVGRQITTFNGSTIVEIDDDDEAEAILPFNEQQGTSGQTSSVYCVRFGGQANRRFVQGLLALRFVTRRDLGLTREGYVDVVEVVAGFGQFHPRAAARYRGIKKAA